MKIIHLILGKARPDRMNGVSKVAHNLALHQAHTGHEVSLWGITPTPEEGDTGRAYVTRFFQAQQNRLRLDPELKKALTELAGQDVCIHIHGGFILEFYLAARICQRQGIRYVYSPHGAFSPFAYRRGGLKKKVYFQLLERQIVKHAHALHFLGTIQYEGYEHMQKIEHRVLIPNGQNLEELDFQPEPCNRPDRPVFSYCGRLIVHYKGLDMMLEALARYRRAGGKGELWLIGDGIHRKQLERQAAELKLNGSVKFMGSKYGNEKLNLLSQTDAFFHPSRSEGFPTGVLEAAGLGLPCVVSTATNVGDFVEQQEAGIHLKENTPESIATAMFQVEKLRDTGHLKVMGNHARQMVKEQFNWPDISQRLIEVYQ